MELVNALRADNVCDKAVAKDLVVMLAPFVPHFAEECWDRLGRCGEDSWALGGLEGGR
jgi:leucyl-tRNA synthetase